MRPAPFADGSSPADQGRDGRRRPPAPSRRDAHPRPGAAARGRARARREALEALERRELLAAMPVPALVGQVAVGRTNGNESTPSIAVNPANPDQLAAVWVRTGGDGLANGVASIVQGAVSSNGGVTWTAFNPVPSHFIDPSTATANPPVQFARVDDPSVAFDRAGNVYVAARQRNEANTIGVVVVNKFTATGGFQVGRVVHEWNAAPSSPALGVTLAVDGGTDFVDPATGAVQSAPYSGNVYVAWSSLDLDPANGGDQLAPQAIYVVGSSDGGLSFSAPRQISSSGGNRTTGIVTGNVGHRMPRLAVAQGRPGTPGGQLSIVWDDFQALTGPGIQAVDARDVIRFEQSQPLAYQRFTAGGGAILDATDPGGGAAHNVAVTQFPLNVNITDARLLAGGIADLDVEVQITHPVIAELQVRLLPPVGSGLQPILLLANGTNAANAAVAPANGAAGTALGGAATVTGGLTSVVFDAQANASIVGTTSPRGYFRPSNGSNLAAIAGPAAALSGTWTLEVTDFRNTGDGPPAPVEVVNGWGLRFSSGLTPTGAAGDREIGRSFYLGNVTGLGYGGNIANPANTFGFAAAPVLAQDNTLGSFSPFQGRLYVAYVSRNAALDQALTPTNQQDNSDIYIVTSDDGVAWTAPRRVNNDSAATDGFSEAIETAAAIAGRPQFNPSAAVDPATGTLALSWYDARHDASRSRAATYVATSNDGGANLTGQGFVNRHQAPIDLVTGQAVNLGPIPDNQSAGGGLREGTYGFGARGGLAAFGGRVYAMYSSNENGGPSGNDTLDARLSRVGYAAGPRVLSGTSGIVGDVAPNNVDAADGSPVLRGFDVTFDRRVDPATFTADDVQVRFLSADGATAATLDPATFTVTPLDANALGATRFRVGIPPQTAPGTYRYSVGPDVRDRIRVRNGAVARDGNVMDQDGDGNSADTGAAEAQDTFAQPQSRTGVPFAAPYVTDSRPLILPGPYVVDTSLPGYAATSDNLALNGSVSALDLTFDRDMQANTFTPEDIIRITGPAGDITAALRFTSNDRNRPLVDGGTTTSFLVVDQIGAFTIADLQVRLDLNHPRLADLAVSLIAPDGTIVPLVATGTAGANFAGTTFADSAARTLAQGLPPYAGLYRPASPLSPLNGKDARGTWTLRVVDSVAGSTGTLVGWAVTARPRVNFTVTPVNPIGGVARTFRVGFPAQQLSGTYTVEVRPDILDAANGVAVDTDRDAGVDALNGVADTTQDVTVPATQVPVVIPANSTISSSVTVGDSFLIRDLDLLLNITHPNDPDLEAYLVAPGAGVGGADIRVRLFANVGTTGTRANFDNTIFDDGPLFPAVGGLPVVSIDNGPPPFRGRFRPQQQLDAFNNLLTTANGGVFRLEVVNKGAQAGTLNAWGLTLKKPVSGSGLGEPVGDRIAASFRVFTSAPTNSLASSTWTPLGPASIGNGGASSRITGLAVDPSDPSGNTVYVGGASGGVWKTTNFLTTDPDGPTYIPLTDFGPTFSLNIGAIAVFPRNNDPNQSIVLAATGEGDTGSPGAGILRSTDGGATWTVLDSTNNTVPFANRDGALRGANSFAMAVDPRIGPNGVIAYAALSNGLWRTQDGGDTWQRVLTPAAGANSVTDVVFDPFSGAFDAISNPNGNLQIAYAAIRGQGVYRTVNGGNSWTLMNGNIGKPLFRDADSSAQPLPGVPVAGTNVNPNGAFARIVLAKPALVPDAEPDAIRRNTLLQGWLYAGVTSTDGNSVNLYVTKDQGQNWTRVELPNNALGLPGAGGARPVNPVVLPSNDHTLPDAIINTQGSYNITMAVDPQNPSVVYIGARRSPGVMRIDITGLLDVHAFVASNELNDGGTRTRNAGNAAQIKGGARFDSPQSYPALPTPAYDPRRDPYINMIRNPAEPLAANATTYLTGTASLTNLGAGARWTGFDFGIGGGDHHRMVAMRDPATGRTRLIFAYDQGLSTAVDAGAVPDLDNGTSPVVHGVRNGNLQINQFYYGAIQPTTTPLAGYALGNLLYGASQDNGDPASPANVLATGNLSWGDPSPGFRGGDGGGVATDQQGKGTVYQYFWPEAGGGPAGTDFFRVNGVGRTNGLIDPAEPGRWPGLSGSANNIAVNPLNGDQVLISSFNGRVFRTQDQALNWADIGPVVGGQPTAFPGGAIRGLAYGAPDPALTGNATDDFIYVGTSTGQVFITTNGGGAWREVSGVQGGGNLAGRVMAIVPSPERGSHEAYLVTTNAVYHVPDSLAAGAQWRNITGNLFGVTQNVFGDPALVDTRLKAGELKGLAVDWRYVLPDNRSIPDLYLVPPANPADRNITSPMIYVGGQGGVFRSTNNGGAWTSFPSPEANSIATTPVPPGEGGGLPNADVTDLDTALGKIDPTTGRAIPVDGDPNLLVAWTYGRGAFGVRLAPLVPADLVALHPATPDISGVRDGGSDSGNDDGAAYPPGPAPFRDRLTNVLNPFLAGYSQQSAFGTSVYITLYDLTDPASPRYVGGWNPADPANTADLGRTDTVGRFVNRDPGTGTLRPGVQVRAGLAGSGIARLPDGLVRLGIQATDQAGVRGNMAVFEYTLDTGAPAGPAAVDLQPGSDAGWKNDDDLTNRNNTAGLPAPAFDVGSAATPVERGATVLLFRAVAGSPGSQVLVNRLTNVTPSAGGVLSIADINTDFVVNPVTGIIGPVARGRIADGTYIYTVRQLDAAGNLSAETAGLTVTIETVAPASPATDLVPDDDSGRPRTPDPVGREADNITNVRRPRFQGVVEPNAQVDLFLGAAAAGTTRADDAGNYVLAPTIDLAQGANAVTIRVTDTAGNPGPASAPLAVTLDTVAPAGIAPDLAAASDSGPSNADNYTVVTAPTFVGTAEPGALVQIFVQPAAGGPSLLAGEAVAGGTGAYAVTVGVYVLPLPTPPDGTITALADGVYNITIRQLDVAGNVGPTSAPLSVTIDTLSPAPTLAPDLTPGSDSPAATAPGFVAGVTDADNLTNVRNPAFTVVAVEPFAVVRLFRGGVEVASLTVPAAGGPVTIADPGPVPVTPPNTAYVYTVTQTDRAGNVSGGSDGLTVTFDVDAPVTPGAPDLQPGSDSPDALHPGFRAGVTDTDNLTNVPSPTFDVYNVEAGATVQLLRNGAVVATMVMVSPGTVSLTDLNAPAGTHAYTARQFDLAGNLAAVTGSLAVTIDRTLPATPAAPDLQALSDTPLPGAPGFVGGTTDTDNLTAINTPTFSVAVIEAGATVELLRNGFVVRTLVNVAAGTVAIADPGAPDGAHAYTVRQYDLAGNPGGTSAALSVTIDTTPPVVVGAPDLQPASDTPTTTAPGYVAGVTDTDDLTRITTPTFDVTAVEGAATLQLLRNGVVVRTLLNVAAGTVALSDPGAPDGTHLYTALQYDRAGNLGATSAPLSVTIDTTAPAAPTAPDLQALSDTALPGTPGYRAGVTDIDNLTSDTTPAFDVGNLEAGATIELLRNGVVVRTLLNVGPGVAAITDDAAAVAPGTYSYTVRQYDRAGNLGAASGALSVTIDTAPPVAPLAPDLQALSDTPLPGQPGHRAGVTDGDNVTFDLTPTFDLPAPGVEANATVQLLRKPAGAPDSAFAVVAEGLVARTLTDNTVPAGGGAFEYASRQVDLAGNPGPNSPALRVVIDVSNPAAPAAPDLQADSDTGASNSDDVTRITLTRFPIFDLAGVEPTATAFLVRTGPGAIRQVVNTRIGPGPLNDPVRVDDGVFRYAVYQVDLAGNAGAESAALAVTIDTRSPTAPPAPDLLASSDTGPSDTDNITSAPDPEFAVGGVEPNATLYLLRGGVVVATLANAAPVGGVVTIRDPGPVWAATHVYTAYQVDRAGNPSPIGGGLSVVVNSDVPAPPSAPDLLDSGDSGASSTDNITNAATPEFLVAGAELTARVELLRDGVVVAARNGPGTLRDDGPGPRADGVYSYATRQVTQAGRTSPPSAPLAVTIDRTAAAPNRPDLQATSDTGTSDTDDVTSATAPTFDLSGIEPGATAQLVRRGTRYASAAAGMALPDSPNATTSTIVVPAGAALLKLAAVRVRLDIAVARASDLRATLIGPDGTRVALFANVGGPTAGANFAGTVLDDGAATAIAAGTAPFAGSFRPAQALAALAGRPLAGTWTLELRDTVAGGGTTNRLNGWTLEADVAVERNGNGPVTDPGPLGAGLYEYGARQVDLAGNVSPTSAPPLAVTIVTGMPAATDAPDLQATSDSGPSSADNVTSARVPAFDVTGAGIVASNAVQLLRKPAGAPSDQYAVVAVRTGAGAMADGTAPGDGRWDYAARQVDFAGNLGTIGAVTTVTIDTDRPAAPGTPDLQTGSDTGNSSTDNITSTVNPTFDVIPAEATGTVALLRKPAGAPDSAYVAVANRVGPGAVTDPGQLVAGQYTYAALQADLAGNFGPIGGALTITVDRNAPAVPSAPDLLAGSDTGPSNTDNVTFAASLAFNIVGVSPGNTVELLRRPAGSAGSFGVVARGVVATGGASISLTDAPGDGRWEYASNQVTPSGASTQGAATLLVTRDGSVPAVPALTLLPADDTGRKGDRRTVRRQPNLLGTTEPGATVELLNAAGAVIARATAAAVAAGGVPAGSFAIRPPAGLLNGAYAFRARARDAAGNASDVGAALALTLTSAAGDYDADGKADYAVYWPANGRVLVGLVGSALNEVVGGARDLPLAGDFDGDGRADMAVFQPAAANWRVRRSSDGSIVNQAFGNGAWTPLEGDYNGDGKADWAMFDPAAGKFYVGYNGAPGAVIQTLGNRSSVPVAADLDGDLRTDFIVYDPATGRFSYRLATASATSTPVVVPTGAANAAPVPADYDGDGRADLAVYVPSTGPSTGEYRIYNTAGALTRTVAMGRNLAPLVADFDGDGKADPGTYRKLPDGLWSILLSGTNASKLQPFGGGEMVALPVPLSYRRPGATGSSGGGPGGVLPPPPVPPARAAALQAGARAAAAGQGTDASAPLAPTPPAVPLGPITRRLRRPSGR
jgi:subtilisin-like proprotein convertase family protein